VTSENNDKADVFKIDKGRWYHIHFLLKILYSVVFELTFVFAAPMIVSAVLLALAVVAAIMVVVGGVLIPFAGPYIVYHEVWCPPIEETTEL
tara:strand:- start:136192 stop:136467 length:276 start_codon:yes stop_codon:yes gene_type:complete